MLEASLAIGFFACVCAYLFGKFLPPVSVKQEEKGKPVKQSLFSISFLSSSLTIIFFLLAVFASIAGFWFGLSAQTVTTRIINTTYANFTQITNSTSNLSASSCTGNCIVSTISIENVVLPVSVVEVASSSASTAEISGLSAFLNGGLGIMVVLLVFVIAGILVKMFLDARAGDAARREGEERE